MCVINFDSNFQYTESFYLNELLGILFSPTNLQNSMNLFTFKSTIRMKEIFPI